MLPRVLRLCVKVCPTAVSTVGAGTKEEGTLIPHLPLNPSLCLRNHRNRKGNAVSHLLMTTASVADRLHIQGQVRIVASVNTVSSRKTAKPELADVKDAAVTKENTTTSPPTLTERRIQGPTPATKTHLEDHAVAEETEKSTVQPAKTAETAIIAAAVADPRTIAPPTTINLLALRAAATAIAREKRNAPTATEAIVTANALAGTAQPLPMAPLTTILHAAHVARTQFPLTTIKDSRSKALAQAPSRLLHPLALATLATRTETTDDLLLLLLPYLKTTLLAPLQTPMLKNAKLASKSVWPRNSRDVKVLQLERGIEAVSKADEAPMLEVRAKEEAKVGRSAIGMKMRKVRKLEPRELREKERLRDGAE